MKTKTLIITLFLILTIGCNNEKNGKKIEYYENGQIKIEKHYESGELIKQISFYENGQISYEGNFLNGLLDGLGTWYHENGVLRDQWTYKDNHIIDGDYPRYYDNKQLKVIEIWKDGKRFGNWKVYNRDGTVKENKTFKDGELIETE